MSTYTLPVPEQMPILSRGRHRSPRKGACLMELVSFLAGEPWSDRPACTHPLLAAVARDVNDCTSDTARPRLALLIPSLIGLTSDDPRVAARVALCCARAALPVVAAERQRVMAVAVLACERVLDELDGRPAGTLDPESRAALAQVPHADRWARRFAARQGSSQGFRRHAAPRIVSHAITGIAEACVPDRDDRLHDMLVEAISECAAWADRDLSQVAALDDALLADLCGLTGSAARH